MNEPHPLDKLRMQLQLDATREVVKFRDFMMAAKLENAEYRISVTNGTEDSVLLGVFIGEFERQGMKIEHVAICPLRIGQKPDGNPAVLREVSLFVKSKGSVIITAG